MKLESFSYSPVACAIWFLDASEALFTVSRNSTASTLDRLEEIAERFAVTLDAHRSIQYERRQCFSSEKRQPSDSPVLASKQFLSFGHSDIIAISTLDALDDYQRIGQQLDLPIEQSLLTFCPSMLSLDASSPHLIDPASVASAAIDQPLTAVIRLRSNGLTALGRGLEMRCATIRRCVACCVETLKRLKGRASQEIKRKLHLSRKEINETKFTVLDSVGSEDLVCVVYTSNYSIATSILSSLRQLRIEDINPRQYETDTRADPLSADLGFCSELSKFEEFTQDKTPDVKRNESVDFQYSVLGEPLFYETHTHLGISFECAKGNGQQPSGYIEDYARANVLPGTTDVVSRRVSKRFSPILESNERTASSVSYTVSEASRVMVGYFDYDIAISSQDPTTYLAIPTKAAVRRTLAFLDDLCASKSGKYLLNPVLDYTSRLVVPTPTWRQSPKPVSMFLPSCLSLVTNALYGNKLSRDARGIGVEMFEPGAMLGQESLRAAMRQIRLPISLRRSIEYLLKNYIRSLGNPAQFESVLELDDFVQILLDQITKDATHYSRHSESFTLRKTDHRIVESFSIASEAAFRSLLDRVNPQPTSHLFDSSVTFAGGLSQIVSALDAVLKCATGLYKWHCLKNNTRTSDCNNSLDASVAPTFGAVARIGFNPSPVVTQLAGYLGSERRLATVDIPGGSVFAPIQFIDLFHETAHLILEHDRINSCKNFPFGKFDFDRIAECFSDLILHFFVFDESTDLYTLYNIMRYNSHPESGMDDPQRSVKKFLEIMIRCFWVSDGVRRTKSLRLDSSSLSCDQILASFGSTADRALRFKEFANNSLHLFNWEADFQGYDSDRLCKQAMAQFEESSVMFPRIYAPSFSNAWRIYSGYKADAIPWNFRGGRELLRRRISKCIEDGDALVDAGSDFSNLFRRPIAIDPLAIVADLLYCNFKSLVSHLDRSKQLHVPRGVDGSVDSEAVHSSQKERSYSDVLLDPSYPEPLTYNPKIRASNLRGDIVTLRALWSISARLKGRRFNRLLRVARHALRSGESDVNMGN